MSIGMHEQMKSGLATGSCDGSDVIYTRGMDSDGVSGTPTFIRTEEPQVALLQQAICLLIITPGHQLTHLQILHIVIVCPSNLLYRLTVPLHHNVIRV